MYLLMQTTDEAAERRQYERVRSRLVCELVFDGRTERAFVLDLSARGVFVQTQTRVEPGTQVTVRVTLEDATVIDLDASVARIRKVHPGASSVTDARGVGLELKMAPEAYFQLLRGLTG